MPFAGIQMHLSTEKCFYGEIIQKGGKGFLKGFSINVFV